jgi:hypothetical protein
VTAGGTGGRSPSSFSYLIFVSFRLVIYRLNKFFKKVIHFIVEKIWLKNRNKIILFIGGSNLMHVYRFIKKIGTGNEIDRLFKDWSFTLARWPKF